jgi:hypothetical protein
MTTTMLSTAIVVSDSTFSDAERIALGGYLAGYSGLTREAYTLKPAPVHRLVRGAQPPPLPGQAR